MSATSRGECNDGPAGHRGGPIDEEVLRIAEKIVAFRPIRGGQAWETQVRAFVVDTVAEAKAQVEYKQEYLENVVTGIALFCYGEGIELTADRVFDPHMIGRFLAEGCAGLKRGTKGNYRTWLDAVGSVVRNPEVFPARYEPIGRANPVAPYSSDEVRKLRSWQRGLPTALLRHNVGVLLAGSLGAGLTSTDYKHVRGPHVARAKDDCLEVRVPGPAARVVVVRSEWEGLLQALAKQAGSKTLFNTGRGTWTKNTMSNFTERASRHAHDVPKLSIHRLRATWEVACLSAQIPLVELAEMAGVLPAALGRYAAWVPQADPRRVRAMMRGETEEDL